jgi:hypothetical protein
MKSIGFWVVMPCILEHSPTFWKYIQLPSSGSKPSASAGFLPGLTFDTEDGDHMFLRNVRLCPNYTALQTRRPQSHSSFLVFFSMRFFGHIPDTLHSFEGFLTPSGRMEVEYFERGKCRGTWGFHSPWKWRLWSCRLWHWTVSWMGASIYKLLKILK